MNKEELIGKLQMVYVGDKNALNELIGYYDGLKQGIEELQQENQKLKKQLEEVEKENFNLRENIYIEKMSFSSDGRNIKELIEMPTYEDLLNQQKEFIEYLTSYIDLLSNKPDLIEEAEIDILEEILSKYRSIIGGKEWN